MNKINHKYIIFSGFLSVAIVATFFVGQMILNDKQQPPVELQRNQFSEAEIIQSLTAPVRPEASAENSQPRVDQKMLDSLTAPTSQTENTNISAVQKEAPAIANVNQEILNSISAPTKK